MSLAVRNLETVMKEQDGKRSKDKVFCTVLFTLHTVQTKSYKGKFLSFLMPKRSPLTLPDMTVKKSRHVI